MKRKRKKGKRVRVFVVRSAITGRFVRATEATAHPATTVRQAVLKPR